MSGPRVANVSCRIEGASLESDMSLTTIVDYPATVAIALKNCRSLATADILHNGYSPVLHRLHPPGHLRPLIKSDTACVLVTRATDKMPNS